MVIIEWRVGAVVEEEEEDGDDDDGEKKTISQSVNLSICQTVKPAKKSTCTWNSPSLKVSKKKKKKKKKKKTHLSKPE